MTSFAPKNHKGQQNDTQRIAEGREAHGGSLMPGMVLLPLLKTLWRLLSIGITIPLWVILGAVIWFQIDKTSSVRTAVDRAVKELVAGAEIKAAESRADALQKIVDEERQKAADLKAANERYAKQAMQDNIEIGNLNDQIAEQQAQPIPENCSVDDPLAGRLHNR